MQINYILKIIEKNIEIESDKKKSFSVLQNCCSETHQMHFVLLLFDSSKMKYIVPNNSMSFAISWAYYIRQCNIV